MNREEMLKHLGVTSDELDDFMKKFLAFLATLNKRQRALVTRSLPSIEQALEVFGPKVSADDLRRLFGGDKHHEPVIFCSPFDDGDEDE